MGLRCLLARLRAEIDSGRNDTHFPAGRVLEPALGRYPTARDALVTLQGRDPAGYAERNDLVAALLRMHQQNKTSYWAGVLTVTFAPMLAGLRGHIKGAVVSAGDLDQLVVEGFLVAIARQPAVATHVPARLRQSTRNFVFERLAAESECRTSQRHLQRTAHGNDMYLDPIPKTLHEADADETIELLVRVVGQALPQRKLDMVVATRLLGFSLGSYIRAGHVPWDATSEALETVLERTKREHSRTIRQLRPMIKARLAMLSGGRVASDSGLDRAC